MIKKFYSENRELIKDNIILFIGLFLAGIFSYLFHFTMGRSLGPVNYGELNTIIAIDYIIIVFFNSIQTSIAQFTTKYKSNNEITKISSLIKSSSNKMLKTSIIISLLFCLAIPFLSSFLKLSSPYILLWLIPIIIISLIYPITRGALQGLQKFTSLSISYILEGFIKVSLGLFLIYLGFQTEGAVAAMLLGLFLTYPITFIPLNRILKIKTKKINLKEIYSYSFPVTFMILMLTLMFSIDILLIKHFLSAEQAGYYAALAVMSKVIFFSISPLTQVMFPKIIEAKEKNKNYKSILYKTISLAILISSIVLLVYFAFPNLAIGMLYGKEYLVIAPLLGYIGLMITFFSLAYLLCFYAISLNHKKFIIIIVIALLLEIISIILFHSDLHEIIKNLVIIMFLFFVSMGIYTFRINRIEISKPFK